MPPEIKVYSVATQPWEHGLVLHIHGVGSTQTHVNYPEDTPEKMARQYVSLMLDVPEDSFGLYFVPDGT
jgi:hypothetical protein